MNESDRLLLAALLEAPSWEARVTAMNVALAHIPAAARQDALEMQVLAFAEFTRILTVASQDIGGDFEELVSATVQHCAMCFEAARLDIDAELADFEGGTDDSK